MIYHLSSLARCELGSGSDDQGEQLSLDNYYLLIIIMFIMRMLIMIGDYEDYYDYNELT